MSELASQYSTQPPSYNSYVPLEGDGAIIDPEMLAPQDDPFVTGSELGFNYETSSANLRDDHEILGQSIHQPLLSSPQQHEVVSAPLPLLQSPAGLPAE